jgi:hypothetical protein
MLITLDHMLADFLFDVTGLVSNKEMSRLYKPNTLKEQTMNINSMSSAANEQNKKNLLFVQLYATDCLSLLTADLPDSL